MFIAVTANLVSQIAQARLSGTTLAVYLYLRSLNPFGNRIIKKQQKEIADDLGISESSVSRALQKLKNKELLQGLTEIVVTPKRYTEFGFHDETLHCKPETHLAESQFPLAKPGLELQNRNPQLQNCNFDDLEPAPSKASGSCTNILDINRSKKEDLTRETSFFADDEIDQDVDLDDLPYIQPPTVETQTVETAPAKIPPEDFVHPINRFEQQFQRYPWQIPGGQWDDLDPGFVEFRRKALQATPAYKNRDCSTADAIVSILRQQTARVGQSKQELATNLATLKQYWNLYQAQASGKPQQSGGFESLPKSVHEARAKELQTMHPLDFDAKYTADYRRFLIFGGYLNAV